MQLSSRRHLSHMYLPKQMKTSRLFYSLPNPVQSYLHSNQTQKMMKVKTLAHNICFILAINFSVWHMRRMMRSVEPSGLFPIPSSDYPFSKSIREESTSDDYPGSH